MLPERWLPFSLSTEISKYVLESGSEPIQFLQQCAEKYEVMIIGGGIWEFVDNCPKILSYVIDTHGEVVGRQEKIHLYAYEKAFFTPGDSVCIFHSGELSFAVLICFDITFFETPNLAVQWGLIYYFPPLSFAWKESQIGRYIFGHGHLKTGFLLLPVIA